MVGVACLMQLAAFVVTFQGPDSIASYMNSSISGDLPSFFIQFKTSKPNTRIMTMNDTRQWFLINIQQGLLHVVYNLNGSGSGEQKYIGSRVVNTNEWFSLNISSGLNQTVFHLIRSNASTLRTCRSQYSTTIRVRLLGEGFSNLFTTSGLRIGGQPDPASSSLEYFEGCIGSVHLGSYKLGLLNSTFSSKQSLHLTAFNSSGVTTGCACPPNSACGNNTVYTWDQARGSCVCKCRVGYTGEKCDKKIISEDDDWDPEFIILVVGVTVGGIVLIVCIVCCVVYVRRTSSTALGVYNPKEQEKRQGQQLGVAFTVPSPEKLI